MDVESMETKPSPPPPAEEEKHSMSRGLKRVLTAANCLVMILGSTAGTMISRLYFLRGGHRQWLASYVQAGGWPLVALPLAASYLHRRRRDPAAKPILITSPIFAACAALGLLIGLNSFMYSYGLSFLPVSTSAILVSTQLAFTAFFAFLVVRQRFTPLSINAVALLTVGAAVLGLHGSADRPVGVSKGDYLKGFLLTLGSAVLAGLVLPLIELAYAKAKQAITYTLVMEMQLVMGFFATAFCTVGMLVNNDFKEIPNESRNFELGEVQYYVVLVWAAILWQCFLLGTIGVIFCTNTLFAGIINAVLIPVCEVLGVIFYHERFNGEKGVALALSLWGLASYSYGEYKAEKKKKKKEAASLT